MARLKDIAEELNLSISTVSRVVNNQDRVDPETRRRVQEAIKRHHYQPDENARRLKLQTSNVIGVIVPDIANPFYAQVIKGIERGVTDLRYTVLLCNTDEEASREHEAIQLLSRQKVAGIIVATSLHRKEICRVYERLDCPVVFVDNVPSPQEGFYSVTIDNRQAASDLVRYLISHGHQRIFLIGGPIGESSADEREEGWRQALKQSGIEPRPSWISHGDFQKESGYQIMRSFLSQSERPTAVLVTNNFMAFGAVEAIEEQGLKIPDDLSIVTFDAQDTTGLMRLSLTSVVQPALDIGLIAADLCLNTQKKRTSGLGRQVILAHTFLPGDSVASQNIKI
ncbi:MAG: LacI family DNA-binding transcriptional regulator [Clostridia bacterium]|nr:LacI family DNA-binding transcriptional regulator [Clostridia bacterium]